MKEIEEEMYQQLYFSMRITMYLQIQNQISDGIRKLIYIETEDGIKNKVEDEIHKI